MKKLFIILLAFTIAFPAFSQYTKGTFKLSLNLGNSPYTGVLQAANQSSSQQTISVNGANWVTGGSNNLVNMIGTEFRYFVANNWSIKLLAGGQTTYVPARNDIPGTYDGKTTYDPQEDIPSFSDVAEQKIHEYMALVGADHYFVKNNVALYGGIEGGFRYGANSSKSIAETSAGTAITEVYGFMGDLTFGAEYNAEGGLFLGLEVRPVSFAYTITTLQPLPGVTQQADSYNFGFLVYPMLKVGIRF
jgi:hypothetical protein